MATEQTAVQGDEIIETNLDAILSTLGGDEVVEETAAPIADIGELNELELEAAISAVERYEDQPADGEAAAAEGEAEAPVVDETEAPAKKGSGRKKKETAPKEPAEKKAKIFFSKQSDRIAHRLGDKLGEFMLLEIGDAELSGEDLQARNKEVLSLIDGTAKKVGEKAAMLFKWMQQGGELNEVMKRAFTLMAKEGFLTSGDKGNLQENLLAKPYSLGTARSQSNQIFCLFRALKVANMDGKGKMVPNPNSLVLMKANATLGL
jgi:hypothetical protein